MKKWLQLGFTGLIFFFMGWSLFKNFQQLKEYPFEINYSLLVLSTSLIVVISFCSALLWGVILQAFHSTLNWRQIVDIWLNSLMAKYLPGGIWNLMGRVYLCQQAQVSNSATMGSMALELLLAVLAQTILVTLLGGIYLANLFSLQLMVILIGMIISFGFIIYPPIFTQLLRFLLKKEPTLELPELKTITLLLWLTLYIGLYTLGGFTFFIFIMAFYTLSWSQLPAVIAIVNFSFVVSLLTPLAPNGLGVREGLLATLLSYFMPLPIAILISVTTRAWLIVGEFITVMLNGFVARVYPHGL